MSKHTPGPWRYCDGGVFSDFEGKEDITIAQVLRAGINGHNSWEGQTNGRLIAAAPELLEALKREHQVIIDEFIDPEDHYSSHCPVCQLIRRVEG